MVPDESPLRQLGLAMVAFVRKTVEWHDTKDDTMRRVHTEQFRRVVMESAATGCETYMAWHTLGVWTEMGKERIGCFSRALECGDQHIVKHPPQTPDQHWCYENNRASSYFEIARVHAAEGSKEVAMDFLQRALPASRKADEWADMAELRKLSLTKNILELQNELTEI